MLDFLILRYSAGDAVQDLYKPCKDMLDDFVRHFSAFPDDPLLYWEQDAYQYLLWLTSLAWCFNLREYIPQIASWYKHNPNKPEDDRLICLLLQRLGDSHFPNASPYLAFGKPYRHLLEALEAPDKEAAQTHMESYLKNWYKGMKGCYWHDRHKNAPRVHRGYWCFEAGMVTLLLAWDDSAYRDKQFYPKDLADYARSRMAAPGQASSSAAPALPLSALR